MANSRKKIGRRTLALLWMLIFAVAVGALIAYEQISVLYVLLTLSVVTLLVIVGFADLEGVSRMDSDSSGSQV